MGGLLDEIGPDYIGRVNMFKLNIDQNRQTAARYGVRSIPTVILFRNGKPVDGIVGLLPLNPLRQKLDRLAR
jgi:thioredoxin-like negative regulator of GroEL